MKKFVVGFMFNWNCTEVVLIEKQKPEWMKGFLNGIGGGIEENETPIEAMVREFKEETGVSTQPTNWICYAEAADREGQLELYFFKCVDHDDYMQKKVRTVEKEKIGIYRMDDVLSREADVYVHCKTVPNLSMLLPMAVNKELVRAKLRMNLRGVSK